MALLGTKQISVFRGFRQNAYNGLSTTDKFFKMKQNQGFTLIELLIALFISSLVIGCILLVYQSQNASYHAQERVAEMQQNLRASAYVMIKEIRMAGYDPDGSADTGIVAAGNGTNGNPLHFSYIADFDGLDNNGNGAKDEDGETAIIQYDLFDSSVDSDSDTDDLRQNINGNSQLLAHDIEALDFVYLDIDGNVTANTDDIRSIQVTIVARSEDRRFTDTKDYTNQQNTVILNHSTYPPHYRRRKLSFEVRCRNLGL